MKKSIPVFTSDEEAEAFVDSADLSEYDLSGFRSVRFDVERKTAQINLRLPQSLLDAVKHRAAASGMPYTHYIRKLIEDDAARR